MAGWNSSSLRFFSKVFPEYWHIPNGFSRALISESQLGCNTIWFILSSLWFLENVILLWPYFVVLRRLMLIKFYCLCKLSHLFTWRHCSFSPLFLKPGTFTGYVLELIFLGQIFLVSTNRFRFSFISGMFSWIIILNISVVQLFYFFRKLFYFLISLSFSCLWCFVVIVVVGFNALSFV